MNRYTDLNKNTFFANKGVVPYKRRAKGKLQKGKPQQVNYQYRYYALIAFFFLVSLGYVVFKVNQKENSVFKEVYHIFFSSSATSQQAQNETALLEQDGGLVAQKPVASSPIISPSTTPSTTPGTAPSTGPTPQSAGTPNTLHNLGNLPPNQNNSLNRNQIVFSFYLPKFSTEKNSVNFIPIAQSINNSGNSIKSIMRSIFRFKTKNNNLKNFLTPQIKLLGAFIENQTLILNFNKFFESSKFGYKGLEIRLQQVLWTMLSLDPQVLGEKVSFVSIIIEGERKSKIGGDGILLKPFYSKQDLKKEILFE